MLRLVLLLVALVTGAAAAWLAIQVRSPPALVQEAPPQAMQDVLVASADLRPAQALTKENMRWQPWPESGLNPVYITRSGRPDALESIAGAIVRSRIVVGEPIRDESLLPRRAGFLATMLPSGKRAVAVRISAENTAGGFILPHDRVDVLHSEGREFVSRTILRNIPVLAIDQAVDEDSKNEKSKANVIGKTATLELDPLQAEIITAAQATGTLSLALRSVADNDDYRQQSSQPIRVIRAGRTEMVKTQ